MSVRRRIDGFVDGRISGAAPPKNKKEREREGHNPTNISPLRGSDSGDSDAFQSPRSGELPASSNTEGYSLRSPGEAGK